MKNPKIQLLLFIISALLLFACGNPGTEIEKKQEPTVEKPDTQPPANAELKTGGLYLLKNSDGTYYVTKILVIDDFAVHLRTYSDKFTEKPKDVNSSSLKIMIGHAPLDKDGFLQDKPELLKVEDVKDSELEGYRMYLEEMKKEH